MIALPPETGELARLVAARRGKTPEEVLKEGVELEAHLAGVTLAVGTMPQQANIERAREIARRIACRPLLDGRPARDVLDQAWDVRNDPPR